MTSLNRKKNIKVRQISFLQSLRSNRFLLVIKYLDLLCIYCGINFIIALKALLNALNTK